jgi:hypothetical protein
MTVPGLPLTVTRFSRDDQVPDRHHRRRLTNEDPAEPAHAAIGKARADPGSRSPLSVTSVSPASHGGAKLPVTVKPGGTAHVVLTYHEAGAVCPHPVDGAVLSVFPPGQFRSQLVELALPQCPGKSIMSVDTVHPGTGIPFFSLH